MSEEYVTITSVVRLEDSEDVQKLLNAYNLLEPNVVKSGGTAPAGPPDLGSCPECGEPITASGGENYQVDGVMGNTSWTLCVDGHKLEDWTADK